MTTDKLSVIEGNKTIAVFIGNPVMATVESFGKYYDYLVPVSDINKYKEVFLKYHSSWDWLMPVVEKIEANGCIVEMWLSNGRGCRITKVQSPIKSWTVPHESMSLLDSTWFCCVEFIKWYNNQNK